MLFLAGYETKFTDCKAKCKDTAKSGNRIRKIKNIGIEKCQDECDKIEECRFFWHNSNKACYLFKWCRNPWKEDPPKFKGSLFKKSKGNIGSCRNQCTRNVLMYFWNDIAFYSFLFIYRKGLWPAKLGFHSTQRRPKIRTIWKKFKYETIQKLIACSRNQYEFEP